METDNVGISETNDQTINDDIQRNRLKYDTENARNLNDDDRPDIFPQSGNGDASVHDDDNDDDDDDDDQEVDDDVNTGNGIMELTQYVDDGESLSTMDVSVLDRSEFDVSIRKDLNFVFDDTVEGEEEGKESNEGSVDPEPRSSSVSPNQVGDAAQTVREHSSHPEPHLTKPFEDVNSTSTTQSFRCGGSKDVAISDADEDEGGCDEDGNEDDDDDDDDEDHIPGLMNTDASIDPTQLGLGISTPVGADLVLATTSLEPVNQSVEVGNRSVRDDNPEKANVSFIRLDVTGCEDTLNDTSTVFTTDDGEISYILHDGSFIASDSLVFGEVGEEDEVSNESSRGALVGAVSIDQRLEMVEGNELPAGASNVIRTTVEAGANSKNVDSSIDASEEVANEELRDERISPREGQEAAESHLTGPAVESQIRQESLPEGFDVNCGDLVYLQDGDGEGRLIQLPSNAVFQSEDGTVTMILPDTSEAIPNEEESMDVRPAPDLFREPTASQRPDSPINASDSYGRSCEHPAHHPTAPLPLSSHPRPENVVGLDQDVLLAADVDSPLFRQRAAATVDVVAEDIVNVAALPPPPPPKKKKKKSTSAKMVEGVVEYDLAGFPEDGVIPTDPTHPMSFPGGAAAMPPQIPSNRTSGPEVVSGIPAGDGDAGSRGRNGAFPCATPGMIQDADTMRALCYDYIDHLINTNRGKIAIPRTHEFGDIGGWGFLHFNPSIPPSFEEYQRHVSPLPKREDFPSKGFSRFLSCRGFLLPKDWERLLPENSEAKELYNLGAMQIYARRLCPDALFDPRDDPSHTPEMGVNDAYYSFLASTQQRRPSSDGPLLAITDSKHQADEDESFGLALDQYSSLPSNAGLHKKKTKRHPLEGNALRSLYQDADFSESPLLALPPPPPSISEASFIVDEANVSFRGRDFEICDGQSISLYDYGDPTGAGRQRALESVPFRHSASYIVPQSNAVAVQKLGKSKVPLIPSIVRNLDRIICRVKGQRTEHQSTRRKGGEFGFLVLGLIRDPPDNSEKIITHRTVYEDKENLARTCVEKSLGSERQSTSPATIKVEAEEDSDADGNNENSCGSSPREKRRIASPSSSTTKRDALRKELHAQTKTPPPDPFRIEKPSNPPPRPSKPELRRRGSRHSMRLRRSQVKRREEDFEYEGEEEETEEERGKAGPHKRSNSYKHYEIFGSEEDDEVDDDDEDDDADDEDGSDDYVPKSTKTRGAKRSGSDESDILRKTRRARRRIIDDAMSEDSGVSDDNATLMNKEAEEKEAENQSSDQSPNADDRRDDSTVDAPPVVDATSTVEPPRAIEAVATRSSIDIAAARKFSKKLSAVVTKDLEDDLRRESQLETSEADAGFDAPHHEANAICPASSGKTSNVSNSGVVVEDPVGILAAPGTFFATEGCLLPPNDEDSDLEDPPMTTCDANAETDDVPVNPSELVAQEKPTDVAHPDRNRVDTDDVVGKSRYDNVGRHQIGNANDPKDESDAIVSEMEDPLDSSVDLFESPHPRARLAQLLARAVEKKNVAESGESSGENAPPVLTKENASDDLVVGQSSSAVVPPDNRPAVKVIGGAESHCDSSRDLTSVHDVPADGQNGVDAQTGKTQTEKTETEKTRTEKTQTQGKRPRGRPRKKPDTGSQRQCGSQRSLRSNSNSTEGVRTRSQDKESIPSKKQKQTSKSTASTLKKRNSKRK